MTERLYYTDAYLARFEAAVADRADGGVRVYLDRSTFYPESGGQLSDRGTLGGIEVVDVVDEGERVAHVLAAPLDTDRAEGVVDWARRFDHMQQHTAQHLLSAVIAERWGWATASVHLGETVSTVDVETAAITPSELDAIEASANGEITSNRAVRVSFEDAANAQGLRKASQREGMLRIVEIDGLDRSACGGTHVRATGEIGSLLLLKTEKVRNTTRIHFVCGSRAIAQVRSERAAAKQTAASLTERVAAAEKDRARLVKELAAYQGRDLYAATVPDSRGLRAHFREVPAIDDALRPMASAFTSLPQAVFVAATTNAILIACSAGGPFSSLELLRLVSAKGGGTAAMAQGPIDGAGFALDTLRRAVEPGPA